MTSHLFSNIYPPFCAVSRKDCPGHIAAWLLQPNWASPATKGTSTNRPKAMMSFTQRLLQVDAQHVRNADANRATADFASAPRKRLGCRSGGCLIKRRSWGPLGHGCDGCLTSAKSPSSDAPYECRPASVPLAQTFSTPTTLVALTTGGTLARRVRSELSAAVLLKDRNRSPAISRSQKYPASRRRWGSSRDRSGPAGRAL